MNGEGKMMFEDGSLYEGNFEKGKMQGFGVLNKLNGYRYEGYWIGDKMHG